MLNNPEAVGGQGGEGGNQEGDGAPQPGAEDGRIQVTAQEKEAIDRVSVMGCGRGEEWGGGG